MSSRRRNRQGAGRAREVATAAGHDPVLRWLIILCAILGVIDVYFHFNMQVRLDQQQHQQQSDWHPRRHVRVVAKDSSVSSNVVRPPANRVPSVLPPIDMGNDESNRIRMTLRRAGIMVDEKLLAQLPSWTEMTSLYGSQPNIIGLERCEEFRHSLAKPSDALIGPAGLFNTGTNFLEQMLHLNCQIPDSTISTNGMRRNVPWGKHTPASWRLHFDAQVDGGVSHTDTLPIVMVKDPMTWMQSMCRHPYAATWRHTQKHCPNLVANDSDEEVGIHGRGPDKTIEVSIRYNGNKDGTTHHNSLADLWNDWYGAYYEAEYPRLIVRYEDLLFYPEFVLTKTCQCAGGKIKSENFRFQKNPAKGGAAHEGSSGMAEAVVKYGKAANRFVGFDAKDKSYVANHLRRDLLEEFKYSPIQ